MAERKKVLKMGDDALPPPGDERREVLAERTDDLQEKAETLADEQEVHKIDPKAMELDRELAQNWDPATMSIMNVSNKQPGWVYSWANATSQSGLQVMMKKYDGWMVVSGTDREAIEHKTADGTRRIADVLLMKIPLEKKEQLDRRDALKRERIQRGVAAELEAMGRKHRDKGLIVHTSEMSTNEGSSQRDKGFSRQTQTNDPRRRMVEKEATRVLGNMSKERIPGVPLPGEAK